MANFREILEQLKTNSTLTDLNLQYNSIGDDGARALAEALKTNSTLTDLNLQYNSIGADGARALAEALIGSGSKNIVYAYPATDELEIYYETNKTVALDLVKKIQKNHRRLTIADLQSIQDRVPAIISVSKNALEMSQDDIAKMLVQVQGVASSFGVIIEIPEHLERLGSGLNATQIQIPPGKEVDLSKIKSLGELRQPPAQKKGLLSSIGLSKTSTVPVIYEAVKAGQISEVVALAKRTGEKLSPDDFLIRGGEGQPSVIEIITKQGKLAEVLTPENWLGDPRGLHQVASRIPLRELNKQLDGKDGRPSYDQLLARVNAATIKSLRVGGRSATD